MPPKRSQQANKKRSESTTATTTTTTTASNSRRTKAQAAVAAVAAREETVNEHKAMPTNNTIATEEFDFHSMSVDVAEDKTNADASQRLHSQQFKPTRSVAQTASAQHRKRSRSENNTSAHVENTSVANEKSVSNEPIVNAVVSDVSEVKREYSHFTSSTERSSLGANTLQILLAPNYTNSNNNNTGVGAGSSSKGNAHALKSDKSKTTKTSTMEGPSTVNVQVNTTESSNVEVPISAITPAEGIIDIYRSSNGPSVALCGLLNLVIKAAGVTSVELDSEALKDEANVNVTLEEVYARIDNNNSSKTTEMYALGNKDVKYKRFRRAFPDFFDQLVRFAFANNVLFDDTLLTVLTQ